VVEQPALDMMAAELEYAVSWSPARP